MNQLKLISQLYWEHRGKVSNKWTLYLHEYDRLFVPCRDRPITLLEFGVQNGIFGSQDDGSPDYAELRGDLQEFLKWYFLNGCLEICDYETGERIARKDEFIPVNIVVEPKGFDVEINRYRDLAAQRREVVKES